MRELLFGVFLFAMMNGGPEIVAVVVELKHDPSTTAAQWGLPNPVFYVREPSWVRNQRAERRPRFGRYSRAQGF